MPSNNGQGSRLAAKKPKTRKTPGLKPSIEQIVCWCAMHSIHLERTANYAAAIAYDPVGRPITRVVLNKVRKPLPRQEEDLERAIATCDMIAEELCILKPSIACNLNA
jgi:hypothetical protein